MNNSHQKFSNFTLNQLVNSLPNLPSLSICIFIVQFRGPKIEPCGTHEGVNCSHVVRKTAAFKL